MERQIRIDRVRDRELADGAERERIAIRRLALHELGRDAPARTGAVLDHHRLAEQFRKLGRIDAGDGVRAPAGSKPDDEPDRLVRKARGRIGLRQRRRRGACKRESESQR
jgi:hypothetical protein